MQEEKFIVQGVPDTRNTPLPDLARDHGKNDEAVKRILGGTEARLPVCGFQSSI